MQLNTTFFALSDPTRRAILARLAQGEATVSELVEPFDMTQPAISRHLKVLEESGLITRRVDGSRRPCRLREDSLQSVQAWLTQMHDAMSTNYNRLDDVLAKLQLSEKERT